MPSKLSPGRTMVTAEERLRRRRELIQQHEQAAAAAAAASEAADSSSPASVVPTPATDSRPAAVAQGAAAVDEEGQSSSTATTPATLTKTALAALAPPPLAPRATNNNNAVNTTTSAAAAVPRHPPRSSSAPIASPQRRIRSLTPGAVSGTGSSVVAAGRVAASPIAKTWNDVCLQYLTGTCVDKCNKPHDFFHNDPTNPLVDAEARRVWLRDALSLVESDPEPELQTHHREGIVRPVEGGRIVKMHVDAVMAGPIRSARAAATRAAELARQFSQLCAAEATFVRDAVNTKRNLYRTFVVDQISTYDFGDATNDGLFNPLHRIPCYDVRCRFIGTADEVVDHMHDTHPSAFASSDSPASRWCNSLLAAQKSTRQQVRNPWPVGGRMLRPGPLERVVRSGGVGDEHHHPSRRALGGGGSSSTHGRGALRESDDEDREEDGMSSDDAGSSSSSAGGGPALPVEDGAPQKGAKKEEESVAPQPAVVVNQGQEAPPPQAAATGTTAEAAPKATTDDDQGVATDLESNGGRLLVERFEAVLDFVVSTSVADPHIGAELGPWCALAAADPTTQPTAPTKVKRADTDVLHDFLMRFSLTFDEGSDQMPTTDVQANDRNLRRERLLQVDAHTLLEACLRAAAENSALNPAQVSQVQRALLCGACGKRAPWCGGGDLPLVYLLAAPLVQGSIALAEAYFVATTQCPHCSTTNAQSADCMYAYLLDPVPKEESAAADEAAPDGSSDHNPQQHQDHHQGQFVFATSDLLGRTTTMADLGGGVVQCGACRFAVNAALVVDVDDEEGVGVEDGSGNPQTTVRWAAKKGAEELAALPESTPVLAVCVSPMERPPEPFASTAAADATDAAAASSSSPFDLSHVLVTEVGHTVCTLSRLPTVLATEPMMVRASRSRSGTSTPHHHHDEPDPSIGTPADTMSRESSYAPTHHLQQQQHPHSSEGPQKPVHQPPSHNPFADKPHAATGDRSAAASSSHNRERPVPNPPFADKPPSHPFGRPSMRASSAGAAAGGGWGRGPILRQPHPHHQQLPTTTTASQHDVAAGAFRTLHQHDDQQPSLSSRLGSRLAWSSAWRSSQTVRPQSTSLPRVAPANRFGHTSDPCFGHSSSRPVAAPAFRSASFAIPFGSSAPRPPAPTAFGGGGSGAAGRSGYSSTSAFGQPAAAAGGGGGSGWGNALWDGQRRPIPASSSGSSAQHGGGGGFRSAFSSQPPSSGGCAWGSAGKQPHGPSAFAAAAHGGGGGGYPQQQQTPGPAGGGGGGWGAPRGQGFQSAFTSRSGNRPSWAS